MFIPKVWIGLLGLIPILIGIRQWKATNSSDKGIQIVLFLSKPTSSPIFSANIVRRLLRLKVFQVAAIAFANGGDNISIYVPLFANSNLLAFSIILTIFYLMIGVWCLIAYLLTRHPPIAKIFTQYGDQITPFLLIGLGTFILVESKSYQLLTQLF